VLGEIALTGTGIIGELPAPGSGLLPTYTGGPDWRTGMALRAAVRGADLGEQLMVRDPAPC